MTFTRFISDYETVIRLGFFFGILATMALWELLAPRRVLRISKAVRWANNLGLVVLNSLLLRWLFPVVAVGMAGLAVNNGWGILNIYNVPLGWSIIIGVIVLDFVIWLQHVMVHAVPALWRLHRVHHADPDFDVTTGLRFHPIEIVLSMLIKFGAILVLGPPVVAVVIFEVLLNGMAMFNHSNIRLPKPVDTVLRWLVVTPDMHRVHHSIEDDETNSNFGFNLSCWDRLFGTYRDQPRAGHTDMAIGIRQFREPRQVSWLPGLLVLPFIGKVTDYAINRRSWADTAEQDAGRDE